MEVAPSLEWNIIISGLPNWFDCSNFVQVFSLQSVKPKKKKKKKKKTKHGYINYYPIHW